MRSQKALKIRVASELYRDVKLSIDLCTKDTISDTLAYKIVHMDRSYKDNKWEINHTLFGVKIKYKTDAIESCAFFSYDEWDQIQLNIQVVYSSASQYSIREIVNQEVMRAFIDIQMDMVELKSRLDSAKVEIKI